MPTHRKGQTEGWELVRGLHPRGPAPHGPDGDKEAREKRFLEPVINLPALGFTVWRFATFTAISPNPALSRVETGKDQTLQL